MKNLVLHHSRAIAASELRIICSKLIKINSTRTVLRMVNLNIRLNHHLQRKPIDLRRMVQLCNKLATLNLKTVLSKSRFQESESSLAKRLRTDQESMMQIISTYFLVATSLILMDIISIKKDTINLVVTMIL